MTPIMPILRLFRSITIDFWYFPWNVGSSESSIFATTMGDFICSMNGTTPEIPRSNSWFPNVYERKHKEEKINCSHPLFRNQCVFHLYLPSHRRLAYSWSSWSHSIRRECTKVFLENYRPHSSKWDLNVFSEALLSLSPHVHSRRYIFHLIYRTFHLYSTLQIYNWKQFEYNLNKIKAIEIKKHLKFTKITQLTVNLATIG